MNQSIYHATKQYQQQYQNISKVKQIVLLYDGMLKFLRLAQKADQANDLEKKFNALERVKSIIDGLQDSLDQDQHQQISDILNQFYRDLQFRVILVKKPNSAIGFAEIIDDVTEMREAWREAAADSES